MKRLLHALAHWLGWNCGVVVSATDRHKLTWIAFRCSCGRLSGKQIAHWHLPPADREFT